MNDEILNRIRHTALEFRKDNQRQPTSVYLGRAEYAEIRAMAGRHLWIVDHNFEACGCKVYEVNQPTHFHVC